MNIWESNINYSSYLYFSHINSLLIFLKSLQRASFIYSVSKRLPAKPSIESHEILKYEMLTLGASRFVKIFLCYLKNSFIQLYLLLWYFHRVQVNNKYRFVRGTKIGKEKSIKLFTVWFQISYKLYRKKIVKNTVKI